jgi:hypothetical protein
MNYDAMEFSEFIESYISLAKTPLVFIRVTGPQSLNDADKANEVFNLYKQILDLEMYNLIFNNEFIFVKFETVEEAIQYCEDHFPESQSTCPPEQFIYYAVYNSEGQVIVSND